MRRLPGRAEPAYAGERPVDRGEVHRTIVPISKHIVGSFAVKPEPGIRQLSTQLTDSSISDVEFLSDLFDSLTFRQSFGNPAVTITQIGQPTGEVDAEGGLVRHWCLMVMNQLLMPGTVPIAWLSDVGNLVVTLTPAG